MKKYIVASYYYLDITFVYRTYRTYMNYFYLKDVTENNGY